MNRKPDTLIVGGVMAACYLLGACGNCYLLGACGPRTSSPNHDENPNGYYRLEVLNDADDSVRVQVDMWARFDWPAAEEPRNGDVSGIFDLSADEKRTFPMVVVFGGDGRGEDNRLVHGFSAIMFYGKESDVPYASYVYQGYGCGEGVYCYDLDDDELDRALTYFRGTDGKKERLFVQDPDRPFYLERDREDRGLGRIVIMFVPAADAEAG